MWLFYSAQSERLSRHDDSPQTETSLIVGIYLQGQQSRHHTAGSGIVTPYNLPNILGDGNTTKSPAMDADVGQAPSYDSDCGDTEWSSKELARRTRARRQQGCRRRKSDEGSAGATAATTSVPAKPARHSTRRCEYRSSKRSKVNGNVVRRKCRTPVARQLQRAPLFVDTDTKFRTDEILYDDGFPVCFPGEYYERELDFVGASPCLFEYADDTADLPELLTYAAQLCDPPIKYTL